jgi:ATP-binding protein involved in chromosome partitioning
MGEDYKVELLGSLPLDINIRLQGDAGKPTVAADPQGRVADIYRQIARRLAVKIADIQQDHSAVFPKIVVQNT